MKQPFKDLPREELERKLLHVVNWCAQKLATEYIEIAEPTTRPQRTPEQDLEHNVRILEYMGLIFPAWDLLELTHPSYNIMKEWVVLNRNKSFDECICSGCKINGQDIN